MIDQLNLGYSKEKIKLAVTSFYLCQGLCFATWASRISSIKDYFGISDDFIWAIILFMIPVGKFIAIPLAGYTVSKLGSKIMVQVAILGYALSLFLVGITQNIYILGTCLFLFGVFWNLTDISLNTQGIGVERIFGKTIMGSFHGAWSLAACIGALIGFLMINFHVNTFYHFTIIALLILATWLISRKFLQPDVKNNNDETEKEKVAGMKKVLEGKESKFKMPELVLIQLGIIGLFALVVESAMFDWGNVYFKTTVKAPDSLLIGFLIFMVMMTVGRFSTNSAYKALGKQKTIQLAGLCIFIGMFLSALIPHVITTSIGFMLVGLGISCIVPTIYSIVGEKSKTPTSIALTILSTISLIGSLIAPLLIGSISKLFNMNYAYMIVGILGLAIVLITTFTKAIKEEKK